jgi:hypothetical protein
MSISEQQTALEASINHTLGIRRSLLANNGGAIKQLLDKGTAPSTSRFRRLIVDSIWVTELEQLRLRILAAGLDDGLRQTVEHLTTLTRRAAQTDLQPTMDSVRIRLEGNARLEVLNWVEGWIEGLDR